MKFGNLIGGRNVRGEEFLEFGKLAGIAKIFKMRNELLDFEVHLPGEENNKRPAFGKL
jgi:hypothetical protein